MSKAELLKYIKSPVGNTFKRARIKRRDAVTGLFESSWLDISTDVKSYGKVKQEIDPARLYKFSFANAKIVVANDEGRYNPEDNEASLWYGYLNQQRTLVQLQCGFVRHSLGSSGQWVNYDLPASSLWDVATWDSDVYLWDDNISAVQFTGIISGDIILSDKNEVSFNIKPLTSIFQDYPAKNLTGWTSTGFTASNFIALLRDQTDGSGSFIFRPFFGDTTANWQITETTNVYSNLNTSTANGVIDKSVWDVIEKLAEAEDFVPLISKDGVFQFKSRTANTTTVAFEFHGAGSFNTNYGHTIKSIQSYGRKITKYYSRVQVKFNNADTATSYVVQEATFAVSGSNTPWTLGHKTLAIENFFIPNTATASTIATNIYNEYSTLKNEITFATTLVPHLDLLDRISITYDTSEVNVSSLWDQNNWADDATATGNLVWDAASGDSIKIQGTEFKFLSIETDIDNMQNVFIARQI